MDMTPQEYQEYVKRKAPKSPIVKDVVLAFVIGGAICVVAQAVLNGWTAAGLDKEDAGTATSCVMVLLSALLTGLGLYSRLARYGGAGTLVLLLEKAIQSVEVQAPAAVSRGEEFAVTVKVLNTAGEAVPACLPLEVTLTDDNGNKLPGSGYYPAQKGTLEFKDVCASNLDSKTVKFTVKCLASGKVVSKVMSVK